MGLLFNDDGWDWRAQQRYCGEYNRRVSEERAHRQEEQNKPPLRSRVSPQWARMLELMQTIEASQRELTELLKHTTTRMRWPEFLAAGGTTARDLERWLTGQQVGSAPIRTKKHLRLIAANPRRGLRRYIPVRAGDGPEAG
jgi:hypothetical protein